MLKNPNTNVFKYESWCKFAFNLVQQTAHALKDTDYDIEIAETHHKHKKDAPSGTALSLGEYAAEGRKFH